MSNIFYRHNETDKVWWLFEPDECGKKVFSFDKKKTYSLFKDYPEKLTKEEKAIFDAENPFWKDFFGA